MKDYIFRQIEGLSDFITSVLFHQSIPSQVILDHNFFLDAAPLYQNTLRTMIDEGALGEAEDTLYLLQETLSLNEFEKLALWFYTAINQLPDEKLSSAHFPREEIALGLSDLRLLLLKNAHGNKGDNTH